MWEKVIGQVKSAIVCMRMIYKSFHQMVLLVDQHELLGTFTSVEMDSATLKKIFLYFGHADNAMECHSSHSPLLGPIAGTSAE